MDFLKTEIITNCSVNERFVQNLRKFIRVKNGNVMSQIIVTFQLFVYYENKFNNTTQFVDFDISKTTNLCEMIQEQNRHMENDLHQERIQFIIKRLQKVTHQMFQQFDTNEFQNDIIYKAVQKVPENILIHTGGLYILIKKLNKLLTDLTDRKQYFIRLSEYGGNEFLRQVLLCNVQVFKLINSGHIDEFKINPQLYSKQCEYIEKCKQLDTITYKYSIIYRCRKCGEKKCRFQAIQTSASDEETKAKITCYNESCGFSWIG